MNSKPAIVLDPLSSDFAANPYLVYQKLREQDAPFYHERTSMVMLSRYEDVSKIATNAKMVRSLVGIENDAKLKENQRNANWHDMPYHERYVQFSLLDSDGDIHRRLRKLIFGEFTTRSISRLEQMVQSFVDQLLDELQERQEIEFVEEFAAKVPGHVIGQMLGAPANDCPQLRIWSEQVVQFFDVNRSDERKKLAETATREFSHYLEDLKKQRLISPQDDLISKMIEDEKLGHYQGDEFISTCMLILMAGHGSTIDVLGSGMHTICCLPDVQNTLRNFPEKLPTAIQEMFRFEPPLPFFHRHALEDITLRGHHFPKGTTFGLLYGAANRDPKQFENPNEFQLDREPNRHLAFGQGAHLCLGNNLARMNMKVIFETLLKRFSKIELVDENVTYKPGLSVRGPKELKIKWTKNNNPQ